MPVAEALRDRPELARCAAPVALAIAYTAPRSCWLGIEVSEADGDLHVVDVEAAQALVTAVMTRRGTRPQQARAR